MPSNIAVLPTPTPCRLPPFIMRPTGFCSPDKAAEETDQRDLPSEPDRFIGSRQRTHAADFDDAVGSPRHPVSRGHFFLPLRMGFVIDPLPCSELAGSARAFRSLEEVMIAFRAGRLRQLHGLRRNAAGAEAAHRIARLDRPSREPSAHSTR